VSEFSRRHRSPEPLSAIRRLRHTVATRLLEAGGPDHVVESITGHLSRRMLEHYSHIRLNAKKAALDGTGLAPVRVSGLVAAGKPDLLNWRGLSVAGQRANRRSVIAATVIRDPRATVGERTGSNRLRLGPFVE
jgi:hypothetical protein